MTTRTDTPVVEDALPGVTPPRVPYAQTEAFRADYRAHAKTTNLGMALDVLVTNGAVVATIVVLARGLHDVPPATWLTVPVTLLYGNLIEYLVHRWLMHNRSRPLFFVFKRHTLDHHSFYTDAAMAWDRFTDARLVFFPTLLQLSFIGVVVAPLVCCASATLGTNCGHLLGISVLAYFLAYEWLHFVYHVKERSVLLRIPGMRLLRRFHEVHHDRTAMGKVNFNITLPLMDVLFGTMRRK